MQASAVGSPLPVRWTSATGAVLSASLSEVRKDHYRRGSAHPQSSRGLAAEAARAQQVSQPLDYVEESQDGSGLFFKCWSKLEQRYGSAITIPKEIIWLNGPPGAGKGANLGFIKRIRGLSRSVAMSSLLASSPPARAIMDRGGLVTDELVGDVLLEAMFAPDEAAAAGVIVDGFPRTGAQVHFVEQLYDHLMHLYVSTAAVPELRSRRPKPSFKVVVLYVDEATSVRRQLERQQRSAAHNQKVLEAQAGSLMEERDTDKDIEKCRMRYSVFRRHYPALARLQSIMPFSIIDATGTLEECEAQIAHELRYQSSMDLDEATYQQVTMMPLAREAVEESRSTLVRRLDDYCLGHSETFSEVTEALRARLLPELQRNAMAGYLLWQAPPATASLFERSALAIDMVIDVLTDRGFGVSHTRHVDSVPARLDLATGDIHCRRVASHVFRITFPGGILRDIQGLRAAASQRAAHGSESPLLTASIIPDGIDHQCKTTRPRGTQRAQTAALG